MFELFIVKFSSFLKNSYLSLNSGNLGCLGFNFTLRCEETILFQYSILFGESLGHFQCGSQSQFLKKEKKRKSLDIESE